MDQFGSFPASGYSLPQKPSTWQSLPILFRATVLGVVASKRNHLPFISGNVTLSPKVWCASYSAKRGINPKKFFVFNIVFSFGHNFCFVFLLSRPRCIPTKCDQTGQTDHTPPAGTSCWSPPLSPSPGCTRKEGGLARYHGSHFPHKQNDVAPC